MVLVGQDLLEVSQPRLLGALRGDRGLLPVMGGVSMLLFGVIAASGIRILVEAKVDYNNPMNLLLTSIVMGVGVSTASLTIGTVTLRGMSLATVIAIILSISFRIIFALRRSRQISDE